MACGDRATGAPAPAGPGRNFPGPPGGRPRWSRPHRPRYALPGIVAAAQVLGDNAAAVRHPQARVLDLVGYLLLLVGPLGVAVLPRLAVPALIATTAATTGYALAGYPRGPFFVALVFVLFSVARVGHRVAAWAVVGTGYLIFAAVNLAAGPAGLRIGSTAVLPGGDSRTVVATGAWVLVMLVIADANRARWRYRAEMGRIQEERERARAEQERRKASDERLRIARELHDVLGHHLSLISVQAGVGLHLMEERPEQARTALVAIRQASAEALREMRGVLSALRPAEESAPRAPAPSLASLHRLVEDAGIAVRTEVTGPVRVLPAEVDRAAYRIVQEALTNVRRHAGPTATAAVRVGYDDSGLSLVVEDDGVGGARPGEPGQAGNGIPGMRERAAALGGTLRAGPRPGGGFAVTARLPVGWAP